MADTEILKRRFQIVRLLSDEPTGLSSQRLAQKLKISVPTINRDLKVLRDRVGLKISRKRRSSEIFHLLHGVSLPLAITPKQLAALRLLRSVLDPIRGTELVRELDQLLRGSENAEDGGIISSRRPRPSGTSPADAILASLDKALLRGVRVRIEALTAAHGGECRSYLLDPLTIRLAQRDPYLDAWSVEKKQLRTFKIERIRRVHLLQEKADDHPDVDLDALFKNAVKTWSGPPTRVRVRIIPEAAWLVPEYRLVEAQRASTLPDGSVVIEADVAGVIEASRWVLSWGKKAEVLEPPELRTLIQEEHREALLRYEPRPPATAQVRSHCMSEPDRGASDALPPRRLRSVLRTSSGSRASP